MGFTRNQCPSHRRHRNTNRACSCWPSSDQLPCVTNGLSQVRPAARSVQLQTYVSKVLPALQSPTNADWSSMAFPAMAANNTTNLHARGLGLRGYSTHTDGYHWHTCFVIWVQSNTFDLQCAENNCDCECGKALGNKVVSLYLARARMIHPSCKGVPF